MGETKFGSQKNPHIRTLSKLGSLQATKFSLNIWVAINASESALRSWQAPSRGPWRPP